MTSPTSTHSRKLPTRSKTLPAIPSDEHNVEYQVSLSRSLSVGGAGGMDKQKMKLGGHIKPLNEVNEEVSLDAGVSEPTIPDSEDSEQHHPRQRSTSTQHSNTNRDYFVYAESASSPTLHARKAHNRSKTLPTVQLLQPVASPDSRTRSHSLSAGSSYTRVRIDDGTFWSATSGQNELQRLNDDDTNHGKEIDAVTLPTIPGSSASSTDTPSPPSLPEKGLDLPDTHTQSSSPTISQPTKLQPRGSSTKRSSAGRPLRHDLTKANNESEFQANPGTSGEYHPTGIIKPSLPPSLPNPFDAWSSERPTQVPKQPTLPTEIPAPQLPSINTRFFEQPFRTAEPTPPQTPRKEGYTPAPLTTSEGRGHMQSATSNPPPPPKSERVRRVSFSQTADTKPPGVAKSTTANRGDSSHHLEDHHTQVMREGADGHDPASMTRYMSMLLALDKIPRIHNLSASFFTWILLAGFVLFPGTFTSLQNSGLNTSGVTDQVVRGVLNTVSHVGLFVIAFLCCGIGAIGMCWLWWRWMGNYVWLVNKIFLPGLMNSLAGLISTISSIYGAQHGQFSAPSKITLSVTGSTTLVCAVLTAYYMLWKIRNVKLEHDRIVGKQRAGKHGEGFIERIKRKANEGSGPGGALVV